MQRFLLSYFSSSSWENYFSTFTYGNFVKNCRDRNFIARAKSSQFQSLGILLREIKISSHKKRGSPTLRRNVSDLCAISGVA